jgi:hypothetical protein
VHAVDHSPKQEPRQNDVRFDSWKEIATFLGRDVRTVQRWERYEGLPIRRLLHVKRGTVFAWKSELQAWLDARSTGYVAPHRVEPDARHSTRRTPLQRRCAQRSPVPSGPRHSAPRPAGSGACAQRWHGCWRSDRRSAFGVRPSAAIGESRLTPIADRQPAFGVGRSPPIADRRSPDLPLPNEPLGIR